MRGEFCDVDSREGRLFLFPFISSFRRVMEWLSLFMIWRLQQLAVPGLQGLGDGPVLD